MRSFLPLIMGLLLIGLPASAKHAFYRIVDVTTGASVDVPRFQDDESVDEPIGCDSSRKVFYALRQGPDIEWTWKLRTISYDGKVLSEKPLPGFHCETYNHGFPSIA